jgi:hypothetical protein
MTMKSAVFLNVASRIPLGVHRHFRGIYCVCLQEQKNKPGKKRTRNRRLLLAVFFFLLELLFDAEDGGNTFLRNVGGFLTDYTALLPSSSFRPSYTIRNVLIRHWMFSFSRKKFFFVVFGAG